MLLYTTKFPVKDSFTVDQFIQLAVRWVKHSDSYHFRHLHYEDNYLEDTDENSYFQILNFPEEKMTVVHLKHDDGRGHNWITDFFYTQENNTKLVSAKLYCESQLGSEPVIERFKLPYLLKQIQESGFAGMDDNLPVTNKPLWITTDTWQSYDKVFTEQYAYHMPVVYVSIRSDGTYAIDPVFLAAQLSGTAHVLVEKDQTIACELVRKYRGLKPYYGAVTIFYSKKAYERLLPERLQHGERKISKKIYQWQLQYEDAEHFSWPHWYGQWQTRKLQQQYQKMIEQLQQNAKQSENEQIGALSNELQEMQQIFDGVLKLQEEEKDRLKEENFRLNAQVEQFHWERENRMSETDGKPILSTGKEKELYPDEIKDLVLMILHEYLENQPANNDRTRRQDVVKDLLDHNKQGGLLQEKKETVKTALSGYNGLNATLRSQLQDIGFTISEGKHYKVQFFDDSRYGIIMSKTPSDKKGFLNLIATIQRKCF